MLQPCNLRAYTDGGLFTVILNKVGEWKVIECHDLYKYFQHLISYQTLMKKILKLESDGLIKGTYLGNKNKHVYLTDLGIKFTVFDKTYEPSPEELAHDLQVGRIVQELLSYSKIREATMYHQIQDNYINPDATVLMENDDETYNVAIELELTQKSQSRVKAKFNRYGVSADYDYCIFLSHKRTLINTYQRYLGEFKNYLSEKFFFILIDEFDGFKPILNQMKCFHRGQMIDHNGLLGSKTGDR